MDIVEAVNGGERNQMTLHTGEGGRVMRGFEECGGRADAGWD